MRHDATEIALVIAIVVDLFLFVIVHNPIVSPFIISQASIVGAIGDKWVLCPGLIVVRTAGQEIKGYAIFIHLERVREATVGVLVGFFAPALGRVRLCEEDTVLGC